MINQGTYDDFIGESSSEKRIHTTETKKKMSRTAWNKGIPNPAASENGKRGAAKLSKTVTGRKRKYISETKWVWEYPTD